MEDKGRYEFVSRDLPSERVERPMVRRERPARASATRRRMNVGRHNEDKPFVVKALVCAMVAISCLLLRVLPWQWVKDARASMNSLFTYDLEFDESLGRLKFVQALFPGVAAVFGTEEAFCYPIDGILKTAYQADGQDHVVFKGSAKASVKACADGRVIKRGIHEQYGNYLMIEHTSNMVTIYYGLDSSALDKGAEVKGGDVIGALTDSGELIFELRVSDKAQNPMRYLGAK